MKAPGAGVEILAVGLATPVGLSAPSAAAAVRAGISRFGESPIWNAKPGPQVMSLVSDEHLPELHPSLAAEEEESPARAHMLKLGALALAEAVGACPEPPPLFVALPERRPGLQEMAGPDFVSALAVQAGVKLDGAGSRVYRHGGAAGMVALGEAAALVAAEQVPYAVVGGMDSFFDRGRVESYDGEKRLVGNSLDGFVPGEGAAFLLLGSRGVRRRLALEGVARIAAVALGVERGHRYSPEPYRGDGLAATFRTLFGMVPDLPPVRCVYAGLNGEGLAAKEWGVAYLRWAERFAPDFRVEHPADCLGDMGAALGPAMLALAAIGIRRGHREEPCLVWSTSDREARGAALLHAATP